MIQRRRMLAYFSLGIIVLSYCQFSFSEKESCSKDSGLLVVVHGSPSPKWNEPLTQLENDLIRSVSETSNPFRSVKVVNLEFQKPMIADGVKELINSGCKRIVCMPLFIARSSHVLDDIPAALGHYSTRTIHENLKKENIEIAPSVVPIVVGPTLADSDLLLVSSHERVKEISYNPEEEAIVLLAHGDEGIFESWDNLLHRVSGYLAAKTGISYVDWAYVHVGQRYGDAGVAAVLEAGQHKKRVLVVGLYLSMGVQSMHDRFREKYGNPFEGESFETVFSSRGFLPDPRAVVWLVQTASEIDTQRYGQ